MKRRYLTAICAAALLLSGCRSDSDSRTNVFSANPIVEKSSSEQSAASPSGSTSAAGSEPSEISSAASGSPDVSAEPNTETQMAVYSHDPKNACTITFDGASAVVYAKNGDLVAGVTDEYPEMFVTRSIEGDHATYTLTQKELSFAQGESVFYIVDKNGYMNRVWMDLSSGEVRFPDTSTLVRNNDKVLNNAADATVGKTLRYITKSGKRDNAAHILEETKKLSDEICEGIDSDYEKLRAISYWTSENIYYDYPAYNKGIPQECLSLEYMLDNKSSVCGGFSNMVSALCAAQGIRCLNISGSGIIDGHTFLDGIEGNFHEWNIAEIDGRYIIIDSGWDSHNYFNADGTFTTDVISYKHFDIGKEIFALDHKAQAAEYRDYWAVLEE